MYEDKDLWPIKCIGCGEEFFKEIGWLKTNTSIRCPGRGCPQTMEASTEEFGLALAKARKGELDPFWNMVRLQKGS
jgi:hypothetical protein